eukprot:3297064-Amphidinium_carterae.1
MSELCLLDQCLQIHPEDEVLLANRARLIRQARRLWNLHTTGAIPPLSGQVTLELTAVLGLASPGATDTPVFPYVDRQSRKRSLHAHTAEELQTNAKAAEVRHRRRQIAPLGHTLPLTAEAVVRRRRVLPPKSRKRNCKFRKTNDVERHMPLPEDPIEDFSPVETPGMASSAQLPPTLLADDAQLPYVVMPDHTAEFPPEVETEVDIASSTSSSSSSSGGNRCTTGWTEEEEEESVSTGNSTTSASATLRYDAQSPSTCPDRTATQHSAEADAQLPSMSCVVPAWQRDRAIMLPSQSEDEEDELPLTHLINGVDHLSPLLLASLVLFLQLPSTWLAWLPVTIVMSPLLLTRTAFHCLMRMRKATHWRIGVSVYHSAPRTRPTHHFASVRIGEASHPGPARQISLSFQSTVRDTDLPHSTPTEDPPPTAEAAEESNVLSGFRHTEPPADVVTPPVESQMQVTLATMDDTPGWDAPRGMNDPAPTRARARRSHGARTAEAEARSTIPASIH